MYLGQFVLIEEHGQCVPASVVGHNLLDFYFVVSQEVVQCELPHVPKQVVCVIPQKVESKDMTAVLQVLTYINQILVKNNGVEKQSIRDTSN